MKLTAAELYDIMMHHERLPRKERGEYIRQIAQLYGMDPATVYRSFDRIRNNIPPSKRSDRGKPRINGFTIEEAKEYAQKVAAAKVTMATKLGRTGETGRIVQALYNAGQLPCILPTSTVNRWLNWFGYSYKQLSNYKKVYWCQAHNGCSQ